MKLTDVNADGAVDIGCNGYFSRDLGTVKSVEMLSMQLQDIIARSGVGSPPAHNRILEPITWA